MYTNVWNDTLPTGSEAANTLDNIIRGLKTDIDQRFVDMMVIAAFNADPLRSGGVRFTDASDSVFFLGDAGVGNSRSIDFKDKTGTTSYFGLNSTNANIAVPLFVEGATLGSLSLIALGDSANQKVWRFTNGAGGPGDGKLTLLAVNDALNASNIALSIARTATTVGAWLLNGTSFTFNNRVVTKSDVTSAIAFSVVSDGAALSALDISAANTIGKLISVVNPNTSTSWVGLTSTIQQNAATSGNTYGSHFGAFAGNTTGTNTTLHGVGIVVGADGNGGTTTTLNGMSINCVVATGATVTTYNGLLFFAPSGAGTISNIKAINIGNMGAGNNQFAIITGTGLIQFGDQLILKLSTIARASLRMPPGTAPTSPAEGEMWYDGTNIKFQTAAGTKMFTIT